MQHEHSLDESLVLLEADVSGGEMIGGGGGVDMRSLLDLDRKVGDNRLLAEAFRTCVRCAMFNVSSALCLGSTSAGIFKNRDCLSSLVSGFCV